MIMEVCPNCGARNSFVKTPEGEIVCSKCGYVPGDQHPLDFSPPRIFGEEDVAKLQNAPMGRGPTSTKIDVNSKKRMDEYQRKRAKRIKDVEWFGIKEDTNKTLQRAFLTLAKIASRLNVPKNVHDESKIIIEQAISKKLAKSLTINGIVSASILHSSRKNDFPLTTELLSREMNIEKRKIFRALITLRKEGIIDLYFPKNSIYLTMKRILSTLQLPPYFLSTAKNIYECVESTWIVQGRYPAPIAGAIIYIVTRLYGRKCSVREIARVAGCSEATLKARVKEILKIIDLQIKINVKSKKYTK